MASSSATSHLSAASWSTRERLLLNWPLSLETYNPAVLRTFGNDAAAKLSEFEKSQLSKDTAMVCLKYTKDYSVSETRLSKELAEGTISPTDHIHEIFFINRFIIKPDAQNLPKDIKRLRISKMAFRNLICHLEIPPMFISSMANNLAFLPFQHRNLVVRKRMVSDNFYILPVRAVVPCTESARSHALSSAGSNQMNPSQYLHLQDCKQDIRPSRIAVFSQHDQESHQTKVVCVDFQDGRWTNFAEEPLLRTKETLARAEDLKKAEGPFFFHLLVLSSVSEWWRQSLSLFNAQLINFEKQLQQQNYAPDPLPDDFVNETNKALHNMVAHIHRYKTETDLLQAIALNLSTHCSCTCTKEAHGKEGISDAEGRGDKSARMFEQESPSIDSCFKTLAADFNTLRTFVSELDSKTQTILALLFNNMRVANDKLLVANGDSMRQILIATSAETRLSRKMAKQSQLMAAGMRKDSTSMKTVAIMTMFFLPATSFAAILSMPFFSQAPWMGRADRAWLWAVLSVPSTILAFVVFFFFTRQGDQHIDDVNGFDLNSLDDSL